MSLAQIVRGLSSRVDFPRVGLTLYLFVYFFAPPVLPLVNVTIILAILTAVAIAIQFRKEVGSFLRKSHLKTFAILSFCFIVYLAVVMGFAVLRGDTSSSVLITTIYRFVLICPFLLICIMYILLVCKRRGYSFYDLLKMILWAGMIQVIITLLALALPAVKDFFVNIMLANTGNPVYEDWFFLLRRGFGFANDLQDGFGYGIAVLCVVPLLLAYISKKANWLLFVPVILIEALANGRTGIIISAFTMLPILGYIAFSKRTLSDKRFRVAFFSSLAGTIVVGVATVAIFAAHEPAAYAMVVKDVRSVVDYTFSGGKSYESGTTASNLFKGKAVTLPERADSMIFGTGIVVFNKNSTGVKSDIGYVNDVWLVGIMGSILMYTPLMWLLCKGTRIGGIYKALAISLILSFVVYQIKSRAYIASFGVALMLLLGFSVVYFDRTKGLPAHAKK